MKPLAIIFTSLSIFFFINGLSRAFDPTNRQCGLAILIEFTYDLFQPSSYLSEWGFPISVDGISGWNSDCKPSLSADGQYLCFQANADIGPSYHPAHLGVGSNIYISQWNGHSWGAPENLGSGVNKPGATKVYDFFIDKDNVCFAGFQSFPDSVVALSPDEGHTWINSGAMNGAMETLCLLNSINGTIYAGTAPNGDIFKYKPSLSHVLKEPDKINVFALLNNYPNPYNTSTTIGYQVPAATKVTVEICNLLGQTVKRLLDEFQQSGSYFVKWDGSDDLSNKVGTGMYFCRIIKRR